MNHQYQSVDDAQAQTTLQEAAAKCNVALEVHGTGRQVRLDCPFSCPGDHAGKRELSVDTGNPQKVFACHAYSCQARGNLLKGAGSAAIWPDVWPLVLFVLVATVVALLRYRRTPD